ncbi:zeta toxin family protein [Ideonella livida]|nr:zeta toxin family protein [Ideonella livida]
MLPAPWLGVYVNADELEKSLREAGRINLAAFGLETTAEGLRTALSASTLLAKAGLLDSLRHVQVQGTWALLPGVEINSYWASALADVIRHRLMAARVTFTFETVMSSPDKVTFLRKAREAGYRTYLYFVATEDPDINVARVQYRVQTGGHPVAEDKIRSRYTRSLALLADALGAADRAYLFDNSGAERVWVAESTGTPEGAEVAMRTHAMPAWFKSAVWDQMEG